MYWCSVHVAYASVSMCVTVGAFAYEKFKKFNVLIFFPTLFLNHSRADVAVFILPVFFLLIFSAPLASCDPGKES